jgi:predicted Na+-dependent transporter
VVHGVWQHLPPAMMAQLMVVVILLLATVLMTLKSAAHFLGFERPDEVAALFCGSQKSLVSGVPIANALFSGATVGPRPVADNVIFIRYNSWSVPGWQGVTQATRLLCRRPG